MSIERDRGSYSGRRKRCLVKNRLFSWTERLRKHLKPVLNLFGSDSHNFYLRHFPLKCRLLYRDRPSFYPLAVEELSVNSEPEKKNMSASPSEPYLEVFVIHQSGRGREFYNPQYSVSYDIDNNHFHNHYNSRGNSNLFSTRRIATKVSFIVGRDRVGGRYEQVSVSSSVKVKLYLTFFLCCLNSCILFRPPPDCYLFYLKRKISYENMWQVCHVDVGCK